MKPQALVVDDDPEIIQAVGDILASLNHEYDSADSVTAARQCMSRKEYTYFVIDLQIPVHSGHGLSRIQNGKNLIDEIILQDEGRKERIIAITAHGNDGPYQGVEIMKKRIADYIPKPFEETGKTLDKAILEMLARLEGAIPRFSEPTTPDSRPDNLTPFVGGTMVFYPDRVELCDVNICSGDRSKRQRDALNLLRIRRGEGFTPYSGDELAEKLGLATGQNGAAGLIRDIRGRIREALRSRANIECLDEDVILSGGSGYRLSEKLSVQDGPDAASRKDQGHGPGNCCIDVPNRVPDVPDPHVPDVRNDDVPNVRDDAAGNRRAWILQQLAEERRLKAPDVADQFECSVKTAQRDLQALKEEGHIKYVGDARTGHYCMRKPRKSSQ